MNLKVAILYEMIINIQFRIISHDLFKNIVYVFALMIRFLRQLSVSKSILYKQRK